MNLFEMATRQAWRFPSTKGHLTVEQVWQLPLQSRDGFDLDSVAKSINATVKQAAEESFVTPAKADDTARNQLDLVRHIIAVKMAERDAAKASVLVAEQRRKIVDALERAESKELEGKSPEELRAALAALG